MSLNQQVTTSLVLSWVSLTAASRWNASNPSLKHDVTQPAGNKTSSVSVVSLTTKDTFSSLCSQPPADAVPLTTPTSMMPLNQEVTTLIYMLNFLLAHTVKILTEQEDERKVWKGRDLKVHKHDIFFCRNRNLWSQGPVIKDFWKLYLIRPRYSSFKHISVCSASDEIHFEYSQCALKFATLMRSVW